MKKKKPAANNKKEEILYLDKANFTTRYDDSRGKSSGWISILTAADEALDFSSREVLKHSSTQCFDDIKSTTTVRSFQKYWSAIFVAICLNQYQPWNRAEIASKRLKDKNIFEWNIEGKFEFIIQILIKFRLGKPQQNNRHCKTVSEDYMDTI